MKCCSRLFLACLAALMFSAHAASPDAAGAHPEIEAAVETAERNYDLDAADKLLPALQAQLQQAPNDPVLRMLTARAALVVAMMHRKAYEENPRDYGLRRDLGRKIDAAATAGINVLREAPETSERFRIEADLWGTMMRTNAKGSQFKADMDRAMERALELGPENPMAYVTYSKPRIFAPELRGRDLDEAIELLDKALELDPDNELGLIFRGIANEKRGNIDAAVADWRRAVEINPESLPAIENLERLRPAAQ